MTRDFFLHSYVDYRTVSMTVLANTRSNRGGGVTIGTPRTQDVIFIQTANMLLSVDVANR